MHNHNSISLNVSNDLAEALTKRTGKQGVILEGDIADERAWSEGQAANRLEAYLEALDG